MASTSRLTLGGTGDTDYENLDLGASADNNINAGAATFYKVEIDNSANSAATYFKGWNNAAPTVGTTTPNIVIRVAAGQTDTWSCPKGYAFATGLSVACVTAGGTGGTTAPSSAVIVRINLS